MNSQPWYITTKINPKDNTAIIIGGGLAGTSAAYSLAVRGWNVKIIERNKQLALEASGNPVGILTPLITHKNDPIGEFYLRGFEYSLSHFKELSANNNKDIFCNTGAVDFTANEITKNLSDIIIPNEYINKISKDEATDICGVKISSGAASSQQ